MNRATTPDGAELAWWSAGQGKTLLLIAGQAVTHHAWDPVLDSLARTHEVLTFDHRGIGRSTFGEPAALTTRSLADDAVAVLDAAGVDRAHVFGHSLGGRVAQWIAIEHGNRVGALVLGSTSAGDRHGPARAPSVTTALLSRDAEQLEPLFYAPHVSRGAGRSDAIFTAVGSRRTLGSYYRVSRAHDTLEHLVRVTAPTLVQHGADDTVTTIDHGRLLAGAIPGARLQVFAGLRHGYYLQSPAAMSSVVEHLDGAG